MIFKWFKSLVKVNSPKEFRSAVAKVMGDMVEFIEDQGSEEVKENLLVLRGKGLKKMEKKSGKTKITYEEAVKKWNKQSNEKKKVGRPKR